MTYFLEGKFSHEDFEGHAGILGPGDLQVWTIDRILKFAALHKACFILPANRNVKWFLTSHGCFCRECLAGVEHISTVVNLWRRHSYCDYESGFNDVTKVLGPPPLNVVIILGVIPHFMIESHWLGLLLSGMWFLYCDFFVFMKLGPVTSPHKLTESILPCIVIVFI